MPVMVHGPVLWVRDLTSPGLSFLICKCRQCYTPYRTALGMHE